MSEAEYTAVIFTRTKGKDTGDTTCFEITILKTEADAPVSNKGSKVKENVGLVFLSVLLAAVVIALCYVSFDNMKTKKYIQTLKDEHSAAVANLTDRRCKLPVRCSCPQTPKTQTYRGERCLICDEGWMQNGESCYYFSTETSSWDESREFCQSKGGDLVKIDSKKEQIFLSNELINKMDDNGVKFWIGLSDAVEEGEWVWVDSSRLDNSMAFWLGEEPDNWNNSGKNPEGILCGWERNSKSKTVGLINPAKDLTKLFVRNEHNLESCGIKPVERRILSLFTGFIRCFSTTIK